MERRFTIDNHAIKHLQEKIWKLDDESKIIVDILKELLFNKLGYYVIFFLTDRPSLAKYQRKNVPSETLPFIFQVEVLCPAHLANIHGF